jgi:hypothetical protein
VEEAPPLDPVKELLHVDWRETGMKLAAYAAFRSRNLAWRTGSDVALAKGLMPEDVAAQAIVSVIGGDRKWEPERGPLLVSQARGRQPLEPSGRVR